MAGLAFKLFAAVLESSFPGKALVLKVLKDSGVTAFTGKTITEDPTILPLHLNAVSPRGAARSRTSFLKVKKASTGIYSSDDSFRYFTIDDYAAAYREGIITPVEAAERLITLVESSNSGKKPLRAVIKMDTEDLLNQASASAERFERGKPLGILDGIPIGIKDEIDQRGYTTSVGTSFLGKEKVQEDAESVRRLREAGALLFGKTNMHEIGIGVTGLNPHFGVVRNPHNRNHYTGGSSSGSAAAVAAGLCPGAVGADGGGSIRIPAALCGVTGLKPTYARISEHGAAPLCWSVAHIGPIAATVRDTAILYGFMAGADSNMKVSTIQPEADLLGIEKKGLNGIRLGFYPEWFYDCDREIHPLLNRTLEFFEDLGADVVKVEIPELEEMRVAQLISIVSEMSAAMNSSYNRHRKDFGLDTRVNLAIGRRLSNIDYIQAQRMRTRAIDIFNTVLSDVDAVITPMTAIAAPPIPPDALPAGESNLPMLSDIMRYAPMGNLTGLPALSVPAGFTPDKLPVGLQIMGRAWEESLLLRIGMNLELTYIPRRPEVYLTPLEKVL